MMLICVSNTEVTFEAQFMKKLSNTEAKLNKKRCLCKKLAVPHIELCKNKKLSLKSNFKRSYFEEGSKYRSTTLMPGLYLLIMSRTRFRVNPHSIVV